MIEKRKRKSISERLAVSAIAAVSVVFFAFLWMFATYAKDNTAATMRIKKTEGTVKVAESTGKEVAVLKNMKLKSGNKVDTEEESYAWITLDDAKLLKMDAVSEAVVRKNGKKLEILLESGSLFFEVSEPLEDDETLNIRTSTMAVGIRGTSGWVEIMDNNTVRVSVLEGKVEVCVADPLTEQVKTDYISTGESAVCVIYGESSIGGVERCDILRENYTEKDINGFVLAEVVPDKALCEEIYTQGGVDLRNVTEEEIKTRLKEEQEEMRRKMEEIGRILNTQEQHVSAAGVWAHQNGEKYADSMKPADSKNLFDPMKPNNKKTDVIITNSEDNNDKIDMPDILNLIASKPAAPQSAAPGHAAPAPSVPKPTTPDVSDGNGGETPTTPDVSDGNGGETADPAPSDPTIPKPGSELLDKGKTGVLDWSLYDDGKLIITGTGAMPNYDIFAASIYAEEGDDAEPLDAPPWYNWADAIETVAIGKGVTRIGTQAFLVCTGLADISIPDSVTSIGVYAFGHCALTNVSIPKSVTNIESMVFYSCKALESVDIPEGVTSIDISAFMECERLTEINIDTGNDVYCSVDGVLFNKDKTTLIIYPRGKKGAYTVPDGVTSIGQCAFWFCFGLTSVDIPDGVTSIGISTFASCIALTSINLPDRLTSIGNSAFSSCRALTSIELPDGVMSIGDFAFYSCDFLESITLPAGVTSMGNNTFKFSNLLKEIYFGGTKQQWEELSRNVDISYYAWVFYEVADPNGIAKSDGGKIGNWEWQLYSDHRLVITGKGSISLPDSIYSWPWGVKSMGIQTIVIGDGITSIGYSAFSSCWKLTSVTIPEGVKTIGAQAFDGSSSLTSVSIPNSVTLIGDSAFAGCGLTSVSISENVTYIGKEAFKDCWGLTEIKVAENNSEYCSVDGVLFNKSMTRLIVCPGGKAGDYTIQNGVVYMEDSAFSNCGRLTSVVIPEGVKSIGNSMFYYCMRLTNVVIPEGVKSIGNAAFEHCSALTSVVIPDGVTTIGERAFSYCLGLKSVAIPGSVTSIGRSVFYTGSSSKLTGIYFGGTQKQWASLIQAAGISIPSGAKIYYDVVNPNETIPLAEGRTGYLDWRLYKNGKLAITGNGALTVTGSSAAPWYSIRTQIQTVEIGEGVTSIGNYAFYDCSSLTGVSIPDSVISIGSSAFYGCSSLTGVSIPDSVISIGNYAFYGCSGLTGVSIPDSVISIGNYAFYGCSGLTSVSISNKVTTIGLRTFYNCSSLTSVSIPDSVISIGRYAFSDCSSLASVRIPNGMEEIGVNAFSGCGNLTDVYFDGTEDEQLWSYNFNVKIRYKDANLDENPTSLEDGETVSDNDTSGNDVVSGNDTSGNGTVSGDEVTAPPEEPDTEVMPPSKIPDHEVEAPPETPDHEVITPPVESDDKDKIEELPTDSENNETISPAEAGDEAVTAPEGGGEELSTVSEDGGEGQTAVIDNVCYLNNG